MAANNTISKLFVVGGSGFVGRAICERAVKMPKEIIGTVQSFSRRGVPESATMENSNNIWLNNERMEWTALSVTKDNHDNSNLKTAIEESVAKGEKFAVLCSVGALFENEKYKSFLEKPENLSPFAGNNNNNNNTTTYDQINRDVCISIVDTVETCILENNSNENNKNNNNRVPFVFISAFTTPPGVSQHYINSKREAEEYIMEKQHILEPIILRPGFLYDESRPASMGIAAALKTASSTSTFLDTFIKQSPLPNAIMKEINNIHNVKDMLQAPPLRVTEVADCILTTLIGGGNHSSILYPKDILQLSKSVL